MEIVKTVLAVLVMVFFYLALIGLAIGMLDGMRRKNRERFYGSLVTHYNAYTRNLYAMVVPIIFRVLMVSGTNMACGREAAYVLIVLYCIEASLIMTVGQRQRRSAHG